MSTIIQSIASQALPAMVTIVSGVLTVSVPLFIKLAFERAAASAKNEQVKAVLGRLGDASAKAVRDISATLVPELKKSAADGKFSAEERAQLKTAAADKVKALIGSVGIDGMATVLGYTTPAQIAERINAEIEKAVSDMKIEKLAVSAASPVVTVKTATA